MLNNLDLIVKLQNLDIAIQNFKNLLLEIPKLLQNFQTNLDVENTVLNEIKENINQNQLEKKNLELELAAAEQNIGKFNLELNSIKSNEKYKALIDIIQAEKQKKSDLEDKILFGLEELDVLAVSLNKQKENIKAIEKTLEDKKQEFKIKADDINQNLEKINQERNEIIKLIANKPLLDMYEKIKIHQNGIAISEVDRETSSCKVCHLSVPIQKISEIISSTHAIQCDNCSRILYILDKS